MKKYFTILLYELSTLELMWFLASYIDTIQHNLEYIPQYAWWNVFDILNNLHIL